jgi:hypothetical protein
LKETSANIVPTSLQLLLSPLEMSNLQIDEYVSLIRQGRIAKVMFVRQRFNDEEFSLLLQAFAENFQQARFCKSTSHSKKYRAVTHLYLHFCELSEKQLFELAKMLHLAAPFLKKLCLDRVTHSPVLLMKFLEMLPVFSMLRMLDLSGNFLGDSNVIQLFAALKRVPKLSILELDNNCLGNRAADQLHNFIRNESHQIEKIGLEHNYLMTEDSRGKVKSTVDLMSSSRVRTLVLLVSVYHIPRLYVEASFSKLPKDLVRSLSQML